MPTKDYSMKKRLVPLFVKLLFGINEILVERINVNLKNIPNLVQFLDLQLQLLSAHHLERSSRDDGHHLNVGRVQFLLHHLLQRDHRQSDGLRQGHLIGHIFILQGKGEETLLTSLLTTTPCRT